MADGMTITPLEGLYVLRAGGAVIAETTRALGLKEGPLPEVVYFPREDIGMEFLERSDRRTRCHRKGEASYYTIVAKSGPIENAGWSYEEPLEAAEPIRGHIAFAHERVTVERL